MLKACNIVTFCSLLECSNLPWVSSFLHLCFEKSPLLANRNNTYIHCCWCSFSGCNLHCYSFLVTPHHLYWIPMHSLSHETGLNDLRALATYCPLSPCHLTPPPFMRNLNNSYCVNKCWGCMSLMSELFLTGISTLLSSQFIIPSFLQMHTTTIYQLS